MSEDVKPDAFEAALAANADELAQPVVETPAEEVVETVAAESSSVDDLALASDEDGDIESDENDPNAEFRRTLRAAIGDWYVIHSYAGYEKKVKGNLANRIQSLNMEDYIFQIEVPEEEIMEIKNGQRKQVKRNIYPGYVLVRMELTDESWTAVRNTPGVTGFVGKGRKNGTKEEGNWIHQVADPSRSGNTGSSSRSCPWSAWCQHHGIRQGI